MLLRRNALQPILQLVLAGQEKEIRAAHSHQSWEKEEEVKGTRRCEQAALGYMQLSFNITYL